MANTKDIKRYLANLDDELNSAALYRALSEREKNPRIAEVYRNLASTEEAHAGTWAEKLRSSGAAIPKFRPSLRTRTLAWLAGRFGVETVLPTLSSLEEVNSHDYYLQPDAKSLAPAERSHARLLRKIEETSRGGMQGGALAQIEGRHRSAGGNALRAAVLGASDGLLSNFTLVMGVAGAEMSNKTILLTGFAGLLAGALSMALGEWISVKSSRELYEKQIATEREEIATMPEEEVEELVLIYMARGMDEASSRSLANQIMVDKESAVETLVRDELGINPDDLGGSAWEAAITSFILFALGAIAPVIPYIFLSGMTAVFVSATLSAAALFVVGAAITLFTGKPVLYSGSRQVAFGLATAAIVFLIGRLIGVGITG
ncbi:MAG: VIT1/CCC1 transporter family protein [Deltaproteobacteria bacterium]|nr:VIT1/CCC1 transporter family protein [Deltaproteobacteria bacterium]